MKQASPVVHGFYEDLKAGWANILMRKDVPGRGGMRHGCK
jgi:hypothetical protein